jgi:hypothetical protein
MTIAILIIWNIILTVKVFSNKITSKEIDGVIVVKFKNKIIYKSK